HDTALADRYPIVGRLWSGDGRRGGTHSSAIRRARTPGYSRGRPATAGHTGDTHAQGSLRGSRQGIGNDLGTVPRVARKQEPRETAYDTRGDGKHGGLHGFR